MNHANMVKLSGFVYCTVVSAHPVVEASIVIAWVPSGPPAWYVSPSSGSAVSGPVPLQSEAVLESASCATPQEAEDTVAPEAFVFPTEVKLVVAVDEALLDSSPVGIGDPLVQAEELVLTVPPEPLPVE